VITPDEAFPGFRLAVVTSHPVQYQAPLFQRLARDSRFELTVYYGHDGSVAGEVDPGFGLPIVWDRPILAGYSSEFLTTRADGHSKNILSWRVWRWLTVEFRRHKFDAVMIHSYATPSSLLAYAAAHATRTPVLLRTESELLRPRSAWRHFAKYAFMRMLARFTAGFLVIGSANRHFYSSFGISEDRLFDTPYAVDNEFFDQARKDLFPKRDQIRAELGFGVEERVVVFSGKIIDWKRPFDLIEAVQRLCAEGLPVSLLLIGDGQLRARLQESVNDRGLSSVRFAGFVNQTGLARYYLAGDILVLPSRSETWGLVVNEAMLFSMPAIVTDMVGSAQDLVQDGVTGYVYKVGDVDALTNRIRNLVSDRQLCADMGKAARAKVLTWSFDEDLSGILKALQWLARRRQPT
jgi:glycosyltransferase involved in cell wall biosynthesis